MIRHGGLSSSVGCAAILRVSTGTILAAIRLTCIARVAETILAKDHNLLRQELGLGTP